MHVVIVQDYIRDNYVRRVDGQMEVDYMNSQVGKTLRKYLSAINLRKPNFSIDFAYDRIPKPLTVSDKNGQVMKYKDPTLAERKEPYARFIDRIVKLKPDIIVPTGNIGCKCLLGQQSISKLRGKPEQITLEATTGETFTTWVLPMYSMEFIIVQPNAERFVQGDMLTLQKFLKEGEKAYQASPVHYEFITKIERVREVFKHLMDHKELVGSWDLETNTLKQEQQGAKPLVMTLSWEEAQGVTIPLEHKLAPWTKEELQEIYTLFAKWQSSKEHYKVGANIKYDIRMLMSTQGIYDFNNNMDVQLMYFVAISQEVKDSFRLSDLAYELTDMGGYDAPLEEFKVNYVKDYKIKEKERVEKEHEEALKGWEQEKEALENDYKARVDEAKAKGLPKSSVPKVEIPHKPKKGKITPLLNEVDGSSFNYEWIPLEILHPYASGDTDCCLRIFKVLWQKIVANKAWVKLITDFYPRLTTALAEVESTGFNVNVDYLKTIEEEYTKEELATVEKIRSLPVVKEFEDNNQELYQASLEHFDTVAPKDRDPELVKLRTKFRKNGVQFRPSSSADKQALLFDQLKIRPPYDKESVVDGAWKTGTPEDKLTYSDYKSDKHNMEWIKSNVPEHKEIAELLLYYSKVNTLKNNFTTKLLNSLSNVDRKVHAKLNISGTSSSRLSSSQPN